MLGFWRNLSMSDPIPAATISDVASWLVFQAVQQPIEGALDGCAASPFRYHDVQYHAVLIPARHR
jgi:hypothetical protein